jgi:hypothetical protein
MVQLPQFDPYTRAIKKYMFDIMPEKYTTLTDEVIDRICHAIVTKQDAEHLIRFLGDIYQAGHAAAIKNATETLEKHNIKLTILPPKAAP